MGEIEEITPRITTNGISMENGDSNGNAMDKPPQTTPSRPTCHPDFVKFIEKLSREMVMKLSDIKRAFQYKLAESDPGSDLGQSGFNEKMVDAAVAQAAGARRLKLCWPKNSDIPEEPIYAWCKKEDGYDELRAELLDSFLQAGKVAGKMLKSRLEESWLKLKGESVSDETMKLIRSEYCVSKSAVMYLKNTVSG